MLGSFSRWLRILGYETRYFNDASDDALLEVTASERAVLLTRDMELFKRAKSRGLEAFFVEGKNEAERLASVTLRFGLRLEVDTVLSRCPTCNGLLRETEVTKVRDRVPSGTLRRYDKFWVCTSCGKVYWQGRHWKRINETLRKARDLIRVG